MVARQSQDESSDAYSLAKEPSLDLGKNKFGPPTPTFPTTPPMEYFLPDVDVILLIILSHLCLPFAVARVCPHSRNVRSGGVDVKAGDKFFQARIKFRANEFASYKPPDVNKDAGSDDSGSDDDSDDSGSDDDSDESDSDSD